MAKYTFKAKDIQGQLIAGEIDADNESQVRVMLRAQKLDPTSVTSLTNLRNLNSGGAAVGPVSGSVKSKDLQVFTRQFAVLIQSGVPIVQSLEALSRGSGSKVLSAALDRLRLDVERGRKLADAMATQPNIFDRMFVNLIRAGEEGGVLDTILNRLADYIEKTVKLQGKIKGAMWYPAAVIVVAVGVVTVIMVFVIPKLSKIFTQSGQELPALTKMVMNISQWMTSYWYFYISVMVLIPILLRSYYQTKEGRDTIDHILIDLPIMGELVQKASIARVARTLSTLLTAGVRILDALDIAAATAGNAAIEKVMISAKEYISRGKTLAEPLSKSKYMPSMVVQMVSVGEQTGNIDQMLSRLADFYESEVEIVAETLTSLIEPILLVVLGGIVAVVVIAMYLPIFNIASTVGG